MLFDEDTLVNDMHEPSSPGREQVRRHLIVFYRRFQRQPFLSIVVA